MTLIEAGVWLGVVPVAGLCRGLLAELLLGPTLGQPLGLVEWHRHMLDLQAPGGQAAHLPERVVRSGSATGGAIWYLYAGVSTGRSGGC